MGKNKEKSAKASTPITYETFRYDYGPTPHNALMICDVCRTGEWCVETVGRVVVCQRCNTRKRKGTQGEREEALAALKVDVRRDLMQGRRNPIIAQVRQMVEEVGGVWIGGFESTRVGTFAGFYAAEHTERISDAIVRQYALERVDQDDERSDAALDLVVVRSEGELVTLVFAGDPKIGQRMLDEMMALAKGQAFR